ncbi:MAG TPA: DoxX family protein [Acidobacteriaceae bacterium]
MKLLPILTCISGGTFLFYGFYCFYSRSMVEDFERFRLTQLRILTGVLELLGGAGLFVGLWWPFALSLSAGGLALLMFLAFLVRLKMKDAVLLSLPSFILMLVNLYILIQSLHSTIPSS